MKWLSMLLLLFCLDGAAQDDPAKYIRYQNQYGMRMPRIWGDSVMHVPYRDTNFIPAQPGAIVMRPADKKFYVYDSLWVSLELYKPDAFVYELQVSDCTDTTFSAAGFDIGNYVMKSLPAFRNRRIRVIIGGLELSEDPRWGGWYFLWNKTSAILKIFSAGSCYLDYTGQMVMIQAY